MSAERVIFRSIEPTTTSRRPTAQQHATGSSTERLALYALAGLVIGAPQLFGGAFSWSLVVIVWASLLVFVVAVVSPAPAPLLDWVFGAMFVAWVWTCLQVAPIPADWARALDLRAVDNLAILPEIVTKDIAPTISLDPGATRAQVLVGIAILCGFMGGRQLGSTRQVARMVTASAVLIGASGLVHRLIGATAVFGVHNPQFTTPRLLSSLMSNNHMGGFLMMGALVATGLAFDPREQRWRGAFITAAIFCAVLVPITLSRGAIVALVFGGLVLVAAVRYRRTATGRRALGVMIAGSVAVGASVFAALGPLLQRFDTEDMTKLKIAAKGLALLEGSTRWLGVGRGAFSSALVSEHGSSLRVTHPENLIVQWLTEWGVPIGLMLLATLAIALVRRARRARQPATLGVLVSLLALVAQNMVDFSLEMPGVVVVVAVMLGAALKPTTTGPRRGKLTGATLGVMFAAVLLLLGPQVIRGDTQRIVASLRDAMAKDDQPAFDKALRVGLRLHPAEPALTLLAGAYGVQRSDPQALRWLSTTMIQAPGWASPHVIVAQWLLANRHMDQALLEMREAEARQPGAARDVICTVLLEPEPLARLERAAPTMVDANFYERAASCPRINDSLVAAIDAKALALDTTAPRANIRRGRKLIEQGLAVQALAALEGALTVHDKDRGLWSMRARAEAALTRTEATRDTLAKLRGLARGSKALMAETRMLEGDLEVQLGNVERALRAYQLADHILPATQGLRRAAELAARTDRLEQAYQSFRELCRRDAADSACARERALAINLGL